MKIKITTFLILGIIFSCKAQDITLPLTASIDEDIKKTYYYKDINGDLNKFLGTWKYTDTDKELIVTFFLNLKDENGTGDFYDEIYAKFKFTENGLVIYNTLNDNSESAKLKIVGSSFIYESQGNTTDVNTNKMSLFYNEPTDIPYTRYVYQALKIEYLPCRGLGCMPQLKWKIYYAMPTDSDPWPFKLPKDIVLTKQ